MVGTDYGDRLRSTLDAARKQILDQGRSTAAQRLQAVVALGHAEQALSVAENALDRNQRDLATAHGINDVAVQGGALIQSADQLADLAKTAADNANSALSAAAASIKTLVSAFDKLAARIAGVSKNASNDDFGSAMASSAKKAESATSDADETVEQLKAAAISASIESAKSMADSAATSVNAVGGELQDLVDRAGALLDAAQQRVSDSLKQRAVAAQAERAAQMKYRQVKIDSEALDDGTTNMDSILNGSLAVTMKPVVTLASSSQKAADSTHKTTYSLEARYTIPFQDGDACYFFALLEEDAAGFSYHDARTAVVEPDPPESAPRKVVIQEPKTDPKQDAKHDPKLVTYTDSIKTTRKGDPIKPGQSYRVFVLHVPKGGPHDTHANDLSYPSRSSPAALQIPEPEQDKCEITIRPGLDKDGKALPNTFPSFTSRRAQRALDKHGKALPITFPFQVRVEVPPTAADSISELRAFLLLEDVYQEIKAIPDDTVRLASLLTPSSYQSLLPASATTSDPPDAKFFSFDYEEGVTDAYGDVVTPKINYELMVLLVPKNEAIKSALLPPVPFRIQSSVPTVTPSPPAQATVPGASTAAPASTGSVK